MYEGSWFLSTGGCTWILIKIGKIIFTFSRCHLECSKGHCTFVYVSIQPYSLRWCHCCNCFPVLQKISIKFKFTDTIAVGIWTKRFLAESDKKIFYPVWMQMFMRHPFTGTYFKEEGRNCSWINKKERQQALQICESWCQERFASFTVRVKKFIPQFFKLRFL